MATPTAGRYLIHARRRARLCNLLRIVTSSRLSPSMPTLAAERVPTAKASNSRAAAAGLWDALDTVRCGHPEIVSGFLAGLAPYGNVVDLGCWNGSIAELAAGCVKEGEWLSYVGVDVVEEAVDRFNARHVDRPRTNAILG